jgi:hypothetical protein
MAVAFASRRPRVVESVAMLLLGALLSSACASSPGRACDGLEYAEDGIDAKRYVPCAAHILDTMSVLDRHLESYGAGKEDSRFDAMKTISELRSLLGKLGRSARLRRPWKDPQISAMNEALGIAYEVYDLEVFAIANPFKKLREYSAHNHSLAKRYANTARAYVADAMR